jgi:hypothetical protein
MNGFGQGIVDLFLAPYNCKVTQQPPTVVAFSL